MGRISLGHITGIFALALWLATPALPGETIAMSFVHKSGRVDVPLHAIESIEAAALPWDRKGEIRQVRICFSPVIRLKLCDLTTMIDGEPLAIFAGCKKVSEPIVREPLCKNPCFNVSASDEKEARELAETIRAGIQTACDNGT
jgi:preprotein translocase subunit SecD